MIDLSRERANRQEFESVIVKKDPSLILLNGHGGENYVMGHDGEILIAAEENHKLLKDKIFYHNSKDLKDHLRSLGFKVTISRPSRSFPGSTTLFICRKN